MISINGKDKDRARYTTRSRVLWRPFHSAFKYALYRLLYFLNQTGHIRTSHLAGFWIDMANLNTHREHTVAVTVAGELCLLIRFLPHTAALPFLKTNSLHFYLACIFNFRISLYMDYVGWGAKGRLRLNSNTKARKLSISFPLCAFHLKVSVAV
jgi:hypothetical protein